MKLESVILLGLLLAIMVLIYNMYQTPLDGKSFLTTTYLYVAFAFLFLALLGKYTESLQITDNENMWKMILLYFTLGIGGICMMIMSNSTYGHHTGFILLLSALSLIIGVTYKYSSNVTRAALITGIMVSVITGIVFMTSEDNLKKMGAWSNNLTLALWLVIIGELVYLIIFGGDNDTINKAISIAVIGLFVLFILSDTSKLLLKSKDLQCTNHACVNYPLQSSSLILDYLNIFIRLTDQNK